MNDPINQRPAAAILKAIALGGLAAGVLDAVDALVAFKLVLGFDPTPIYQFVASGALGPSAFSGGAATALLGLGFHFLIAFSAAAAFVLASLRLPVLRQRPALAGGAFGVSVYAFMNYLVLPLSLVGPASFSLPLFVNGVFGHALFVGVPIAYAARACLGHGARSFRLAETPS
jgi:hypothetical protein